MIDCIRDLKNIHEEEHLFILATGPSLSEMNLAPLTGQIVMGLNHSALLFPDSHYQCIMDATLLEKLSDLFKRPRQIFTPEDSALGTPLKLLGAEGFSRDLEEGIYTGYSVSYLALQLAVYMGFTDIYYLALDLNRSPSHEHVFGTEHDPRHHENTEFPRVRKMLEYAAKELEPSGVHVFNCSPVSDLECFPRITYERALQETSQVA